MDYNKIKLVERKYHIKEWSSILDDFKDANYYQTWAYGTSKWGEDKIYHLLLYKNNNIIAVAQVIKIKIPIIKLYIVFIPFGPLWRKKKDNNDINNLKLFIDKVRYKYKKACIVKIRSNEICINNLTNGEKIINNKINEIFKNMKYRQENKHYSYRTINMSLNNDIDSIKAGLRPKWRQTLNNLDKKNIKIEIGNKPELYEKALIVYREMKNRKKFKEYVDKEYLKNINNKLPNTKNIKAIVAMYNSKPVSSIIVLTIGERAFPLLAATSNKGLKLHSSYLVWWKMIEILKERGIKECDLGGISPDRNPGTYFFRKGLSGKNGRDEVYCGEFTYLNNKLKAIGMVINIIIKIRERLK